MRCCWRFPVAEGIFAHHATPSALRCLPRRLESEVLAPVPHRQYVFTIPKLLRLHFRFDRRLLGLLSACAYQSILEMMQAVVSEPGAVPGLVAAIQTYGDQGANWHPHVHAIVTDGIFLPDATFRALPPPDYQQLLLLFRHKLMRRLLKLEKITEATVEILDRFRHPGFSAFQGPAIQPEDTVAREKLAIYMLIRQWPWSASTTSRPAAWFSIPHGPPPLSTAPLENRRVRMASCAWIPSRAWPR